MNAHIIARSGVDQMPVPGVGHVERELIRDGGSVVAGDWLLFDTDTDDRRLVCVVSAGEFLLIWLAPDAPQPATTTTGVTQQGTLSTYQTNVPVGLTGNNPHPVTT